MRGFDPRAVTEEHVRKVMFLYGKDVPGMMLRMARFEELVEESGCDLHRYSTLDADALGYMQAGDLFSDDVFVSVHDISPALGSSSESQKKLKILMKAVATYPQTSRFLFSAESPQGAKSLGTLIDFVKSQNGIAREVKAPSAREMSEWIREYLSSTGRAFPTTSVELVASVSGGDVNVARTILDNIGEEVASLSRDDIAEWLDIDRNTPLSSVYEAVCRRDLASIISYRRTFNVGQSGLRLFLLKMRYVVFDLMLLVECEEGGLQPFFDYKKAQYGRSGVNARQIRALALDNAPAQRYRELYRAVNEALSRISGASSKEFSYSWFYSQLIA